MTVEKMATAIKVHSREDGKLIEPYTQFCHWNGSFDVMLFGRRNRPSWETAELKMYYRADINERTHIFYGGRKFAVIHAENFEQRGKFMIVKVGRLIALKKFKVFSPEQVVDDYGGVYNEHRENSGELEANIFPYDSGNSLRPCGIDLQYAFELYSMDELTELKEMDRFGVDAPDYEVKTIEDWGFYRKVIAEKVNHG